MPGIKREIAERNMAVMTGEKISLANKQKWAEPGFREMMIERRKKK